MLIRIIYITKALNIYGKQLPEYLPWNILQKLSKKLMQKLLL